jgi:uridine kinase
MDTKVVAIDGHGAAGKSTLARRLARKLGGATIVPTDDFASWDNPIDWWPQLVEQVLKPLSEGRVAHYRRYDWEARRLAEWVDVVPAGYVVLEGVSASRQAFRPFLAFTVWVDAPSDVRLRRGLERDGEDARARWIEWMAAEDRYVEQERPDRHADMVIDGTEAY